MTKLTGIRSLFECLRHPSGDFSALIPSLKQQCLLFDRIGFLGLDDEKNPFISSFTKEYQPEIERLKENGIIYKLEYPTAVAPENEKAEFLKYLSDISMGDEYWRYFIPIIKKSYKSYGIFSQKAKKLRLNDHQKEEAIKKKILSHASKENVSIADVIHLRNLLNKYLDNIHKFTHDSEELINYLGSSQLKRESIIARFISVKTMYF